MTFNIGSQQGGVINNVAGDQTVNGDQLGAVTLDVARGRSLLVDLRRELAAARLPAEARDATRDELDAFDRELDCAEPDPNPLRDRLTSVAQILVSAGAVVSAGTGVGAALGALAAWLGPIGKSITRLLSR